MTLSKRTILIIVSTFIALLFILAGTSDIILLRSFAALEREVLSSDVQKVRNEIDESYDELSYTSRAIATDHDLSSLTRLGVQFFENHRIDVAVCFSSSGAHISSNSADPHKHVVSPVSDHLLAQFAGLMPLAHKNPRHLLSGLLLLDGRPLQIVLRQDTASGLYLLIGRYLDIEEVRRVSALTAFKINLLPVAQKPLPADLAFALSEFGHGVTNPNRVIDNDTIAGYTMFEDLHGAPVMVGKITKARTLYKQGQVAIAYIIAALFLTTGVLCSVMLIFIRGTILKRISHLGGTVSSITEQRDITSRVPVSGEQDELTDLAVSINSMLAALEAAEAELHESEERYRMLFERAPDSIFIIGLEGEEKGRITAANSAAAQQHGYTIDEMCRMRISDLNTEESNRIAGSLFERISKGEWVTHEVWHHKKDGSQFPLEIHAGKVRIKGRDYILGFDRDITSRKLAEASDAMYLDQIRQLNRELSNKAAELSAANSELETFNYSVSHDMRGPLTRISGYCQMLLDDGMTTDPEARMYITRIYESGTWLNEMIDAMLNLANLSRAEFVQERVDLTLMADEIMRELMLSEPERDIRLHIAREIAVDGDQRLLKILMANLLGNAWKYSSRNSEACIEFGVRHLPDAPSIYFVKDNGAGFDMKDAGRLFRPFIRLHDQEQFAGTGIGLATVQRVIARHGGRIWAEGEIGLGATIFFTLAPESGMSTAELQLDGLKRL